MNRDYFLDGPTVSVNCDEGRMGKKEAREWVMLDQSL